MRISSAYGFNPLIPDQGVLNKWLYCAKNGSEILLYNSFDSFVNFISFKQISQAIEICIKNNLTGCYNIGSEKSTSLSELYSIVCKIANKDKINYKIKSSKDRIFNLDTSLFKSKTNIVFNDNLFLEGKNIYKLIN